MWATWDLSDVIIFLVFPFTVNSDVATRNPKSVNNVLPKSICGSWTFEESVSDTTRRPK